jgi:hypothetical protein
MKVGLIQRDPSGLATYGLPFSTNAYGVLLTQDTDTQLTVPPNGNGGKWLAMLMPQGSANVFCALNAPAAIYTNTAFEQVDAELVLGQSRVVKSGDVLHFSTSSSAAYVTVIFYGLE